MKEILRGSVISGLIVIGLGAGCHHKTDAKTELEKTAELLAKPAPEPATAAQTEPAPNDPAPVTANLPSGESPEQATPIVPPAQQMLQALAAYKAGELEDAVIRLQKLRRLSALTPEQRMAVQDSVAAVMQQIYEMAGKGDARAIEAVRQYEEMQTSRH
jgi:hypothetical protein